MKRKDILAAFTVLLAITANASYAKEAESTDDTSNEIVVIGTRSARALKDLPVQVRVIDRREIVAAGDMTAADAVTRIVGVQVSTSLRTGQSPQIQGFGSKHVLVLVDGRRVSGRLADDFDLSRIPASSIQRIEVLKGASSVLYGSDAIGGVINIVTTRPRAGLHAKASTSRDSLQRNEVALSVSGGNETVAARIDANHQAGPAYDLNPDDVVTTGSAYERNNVRVALVLAASASLEISALIAGDQTTTEGVSLGSANSVIDLWTKGQGREAVLSGRYLRDGGGEVRFEIGESQRTYELRDDQRGSAASDRQLGSKEMTKDVSLIAALPFSDAHATTAGIETARQNFDSNQIGDRGEERLRNGVFVQHEWRPVSVLALVPGLRYDVDSQFKEHMTKAFTMRYDASESLALRASYGEGFRAPSFSELYLSFANPARGYRVEGNSDLDPETSHNVQASAAWQPSLALWLSLGVFDNRVKDLIGTVRTRESGLLVINYANLESVRNRGVEAAGRLMVQSRVTLGLDYMYLEAREEERDRMLEGRAMHSGALQTRYEDRENGLNAALTMSLVGRRPFYTETAAGTQTAWSKSYRSANLRLGKKFGEFLELFTGVRNLTDESQEEYAPVPPRSYFAGVGAQL